MRIIAGEFRGRKLLSPESDTTRPITDRVKQSLFDIVAPDIPGHLVCDCFSGTGSMGLESLSRGARQVLFFEADRSALRQLNQNIATLAVQNRARIIPGDLFRWFAQVAPPEADRAAIIFLDPPYRFVVQRSDEIRRLIARMISHHLASDGYIVFRHESKDNLALTHLDEFDRREYGNMTLRFLRASRERQA